MAGCQHRSSSCNQTPETKCTSRSACRVGSPAHALPPGRERFGFSDSEANSQTRRAAGGRKGKGHEPARTITHAPGAAQVTVAYLPHALSEGVASAPGALRELLECPQLQHRRV